MKKKDIIYLYLKNKERELICISQKREMACQKMRKIGIFCLARFLLYNGASKNERDFLQGGYTNGYEKGIGSNQK